MDAGERIGPWFRTFSGVRFFPLNVLPDDINLADIAHHLSMKCRFGGAVKKFISVAEHSILVSRRVDNKLAMWGLMHDAAEAYLGDIVSPCKRSLWYATENEPYKYHNFAHVEEELLIVIADKFGLNVEDYPAVKDTDRRALEIEARHLMGTWESADDLTIDDDCPIYCWTPLEAEREFLARFHEIRDAQRYEGALSERG